MAKKKSIGTLAKDIYEVKNIVGDPRYMHQAALYVQGAARRRAPADMGTLRNSISVAVVENPGQLVAHIGTNLEYALYVELGTGPKGAADHFGISPDIQPAYTMSPWWIHESQVPPGTGEKYHWFYITTKEGRFYQVTGQPAQPYLYPALKDNEQEIGNLLAEGWEKAIRKAL